MSRQPIEITEHKERNAITAEALKALQKIGFLSRHPRNNDVNTILQALVYGQRDYVRSLLNKGRDRYGAAFLKAVLTAVPTEFAVDCSGITDYSGKKIEDMTLLQAAIAAGDVALHPDLIAEDIRHQGMCELIQSYFLDDKAEMARQYQEILTRSLLQDYPNEPLPTQENDLVALHEALQKAQEKNTFDFSAIVIAITQATENEVVEALNRFREKFEQHALKKIAINLYDLLKACKVFTAAFQLWAEDQRDLFAHQVIGFVQRYLSAADARAFTCGLRDAVKKKCVLPDQFNFKTDDPDPGYLGYCFYPVSHSCSGLGFDYMTWGGYILGKTRYIGKPQNMVDACNVYIKQKQQAFIQNLSSLCPSSHQLQK